MSSGSVRNLLHFILTSATCSVTSLRGNESLTRQSDSEACGDGKEGKLAFKVKAKTRRIPNKLTENFEHGLAIITAAEISSDFL